MAGLCGGSRCGCTLTAGAGASLGGSGTAADPWEISGVGGVVAYGQIVANSAGFTTTPLTIISVTFNAVAGRRYRVGTKFDIQSTASNDIPVVSITDGAGAQKQRATMVLPSGGFSYTMNTSVVEDGLSGSITRRLVGVRALGTGTLNIDAGSTNPAYLLVEDIGAL